MDVKAITAVWSGMEPNSDYLKIVFFHSAESFAGALYGALETLPSKSVSKESYAETGNLPDWCTITSWWNKDWLIITFYSEYRLVNHYILMEYRLLY